MSSDKKRDEVQDEQRNKSPSGIAVPLRDSSFLL
jgi:hypothetical protein